MMVWRGIKTAKHDFRDARDRQQMPVAHFGKKMHSQPMANTTAVCTGIPRIGGMLCED